MITIHVQVTKFKVGAGKDVTVQNNSMRLNEAPQNRERLGSVRTLVVLWLVVLALGIALIPLVILSGWVRGDSARLQDELQRVELVIADTEMQSPDVLSLDDAAAANEAIIEALSAVVVPLGLDWPRIVAAMAGYDPLLLRIETVTQREDRLRVTGRAVSNDAVIRYAQRLLDAGVFSSVVILSQIAAPPPAPDSAPARAPDPNAAPSPFGSVEFEIDLMVIPPANPGESIQ